MADRRATEPNIRRTVDRRVRELFGDLLVPGNLPHGFSVVDFDVEQGPTLHVARENQHLRIELGERSLTRDCHCRTRRFNLYARDPRQDRALGEADRLLLAHVTRELERREGELPRVARAPATGRFELRQIDVERVLIREGPGQYYLNPYVGCAIGCRFCFVNDQADVSRALDGLPHATWGRWVDVKANAAEVLAREVREVEPGIVRMSPILTDPYQPLERRHRITRRCLEVLLDAGFTPCILTRAARLTEDLPLLSRFDRALVGFSVPTDDDAMRHRFEPGADRIADRIRALRMCHDSGLVTFAVIQPMLPLDPARLVSLLSPWIRRVRIDRLHRSELVASIYEQNGLLAQASDAYFDATRAELTRLFAERSVPTDELEDLSRLRDSTATSSSPSAARRE
ncbi:MAG: radical SAM protein [Myxococcales bacterium]|nr:radical SAM protein [Myxococcales bacterium]